MEKLRIVVSENSRHAKLKIVSKHTLSVFRFYPRFRELITQFQLITNQCNWIWEGKQKCDRTKPTTKNPLPCMKDDAILLDKKDYEKKRPNSIRTRINKNINPNLYQIDGLQKVTLVHSKTFICKINNGFLCTKKIFYKQKEALRGKWYINRLKSLNV